MIVALSLSLSMTRLCLVTSCALIRKMHTCPAIFLTPFPSKFATQRSLTSLGANPMDGASPHLSFSPLHPSFSWPEGTYYAAYASVLYGVTDYYGAHTAPRLQALCRGYNSLDLSRPRIRVPYC